MNRAQHQHALACILGLDIAHPQGLPLDRAGGRGLQLGGLAEVAPEIRKFANKIIARPHGLCASRYQ